MGWGKRVALAALGAGLGAAHGPAPGNGPGLWGKGKPWGMVAEARQRDRGWNPFTSPVGSFDNPDGGREVFERIVDRTRRPRRVKEEIFSDGGEEKDEMAVHLASKAMPFDFVFRHYYPQHMVRYKGQVGICKKAASTERRGGEGGEFEAFTAYHNIKHFGAADDLPADFEVANQGVVLFQVRPLSPFADVRKPRQVGRGDGPWPFGYDVAAGPLAFMEEAEQRGKAHEVASRRPQVGDEVAMAVQTGYNATKRIAEGRWGPVFGPGSAVCVYFGKIVSVKGDFFEHDINAYSGCSGAMLAYASGEEQGRAFGVHALGTDNYNGGFTLPHLSGENV